LGIPTMVVTRGGFSQVVGNAFAGLGFAPEGPSIFEFPIDMFLPGSDLTPLNENIDKIVYGLTKWQPKVTQKGIYYAPSDIKVQGADYQEAFDNVNNLYMWNQWGDGLPIVPPTEERVNWILTGTDLPHDTPIGEKVLPRGGIATVHDIAVNLAMAGGRPEYLPVVIATIEAMTEPLYELWHGIPTTRNNWPAIIVNGTIGKEIRINCAEQTMGPHNQFPAQGPIGRCVRFMMQNFGGAIAGIGTMAIYGAMLYTNTVLTEDEDGVPPGWPTYGEERGFPRGANCVTVTPVQGIVRIGHGGSTQEYLENTVEVMGYLKAGSDPTNTDPDVKAGLLLIPRGFAASLHDELGYSRDDLRQYLWEGTQMTANPSQLTVVVAGGKQSGHACWLPESHLINKITKAIKLPAKWNELLKEAEEDLGPIQPSHG
jgi:hypothetical protein